MSRQRLPDRLLFRLLGWIGLNLGLLLFFVCFSGTVATLSHEIDWLLNPAIRAAPAALIAPPAVARLKGGRRAGGLWARDGRPLAQGLRIYVGRDPAPKSAATLGHGEWHAAARAAQGADFSKWVGVKSLG